MAHTMLPTCQTQSIAYSSRISSILSFVLFISPFTVSVFAVVVILG